jgi:ribose 5-phosphate isomerase B
VIVGIGCDHGGFELKEAVSAALKELNLEIRDFGTHDRNSCDYPDFAGRVAAAVAAGECDQGVLICGTGLGMSITANKVPGIRAVCVSDTFSARMGRAHNDANILCLGARVVGPGLAQDLVRAYFGASFEGGRHAARVEKIAALERR